MQGILIFIIFARLTRGDFCPREYARYTFSHNITDAWRNVNYIYFSSSFSIPRPARPGGGHPSIFPFFIIIRPPVPRGARAILPAGNTLAVHSIYFLGVEISWVQAAPRVRHVPERLPEPIAIRDIPIMMTRMPAQRYQVTSSFRNVLARKAAAT